MCELLVRAKDNFNPDPEEDRRGCYKRGYVVVVMDDGHIWGRMEGPPDFVVVKLPGVPKEEMMKYLEPETVVVPTERGEDAVQIYRRRLWKINLDEIDIEKPMTVEELKTHIVNLKTGLLESVMDGNEVY